MKKKNFFLVFILSLIVFLFSAGLVFSVPVKLPSKKQFESFASSALVYSLYWFDGFIEWGKGKPFLGIHQNVGKKIKFDVWQVSDPYSSNISYDLVFPDIGIGENLLRASAIYANGELFMKEIDGAGRVNVIKGTNCKKLYKSLTASMNKNWWMGIAINNRKLDEKTAYKLRSHFIKVFLNDFDEIKKSKNGKCHFFVGPYEKSEKFDSYVMVYWLEKNKIYYYPVLPAIYGEEGRRDFELSPEASAIRSEEVMNIWDAEEGKSYVSMDRMIKNCVVDGTLIEIEYGKNKVKNH